MGLSLGAVGVGVLLAALACVLIRHNHRNGLKAYKAASVLALVSGLCLSGAIVGYAGSITHLTVGGVGIVLFAVVVGGLDFIIMMRGHGHHAIWTPVVGFVVGVALVLAPGALGHLAQNAQSTVVTTVHRGTTATVGGG